MRRSLICLWAICTALVAPANAQEADIGPDNSVLVPFGMTSGRAVEPVKKKVYGAEHQWPGTAFDLRFQGTNVIVSLDDSVNMYNLYVDDQPVRILDRVGDKDIPITGLKPGWHTVRLEKRTESQGATGIFKGFSTQLKQFKQPSFLRTLRSTVKAHWEGRAIEFIGDSYTVGYGNISGKRQCTGQEIWATTNTSQAFGPLTAKHYGADYQINAISGRGIVRNWDGGGGDTLPEVYPYALFDKSKTYENRFWKPQIIVIGLGTNDFSTQLHTGEKWPTREALQADYEATYTRFVQDLRAKNPDAFFILMASDQVDGEIQAEVKKVIASLQAKGESRIAFVGFSGLDYMGCNWHPSAADDVLVSQILITFIDAHPELWQGK